MAKSLLTYHACSSRDTTQCNACSSIRMEQVVQLKSQMTVKFTASEAGAYSYICQMHPPHLGGQLLILST